MSQSLRVSGSLLARLSSPAAFRTPRRAFTISAAARADLIQDMYLKELKAYKPTPPKASEASESTKKWVTPQPPKSPEETNLASDMKAYEDQVVEIEGQAAASETQQSPDEDYFEDLKVFDETEKAH